MSKMTSIVCVSSGVSATAWLSRKISVTVSIAPKLFSTNASMCGTIGAKADAHSALPRHACRIRRKLSRTSVRKSAYLSVVPGCTASASGTTCSPAMFSAVMNPHSFSTAITSSMHNPGTFWSTSRFCASMFGVPSRFRTSSSPDDVHSRHSAAMFSRTCTTCCAVGGFRVRSTSVTRRIGGSSPST